MADYSIDTVFSPEDTGQLVHDAHRFLARIAHYLASKDIVLRFQDREGISNGLFQAHLCRPPAFAATKRLNFTKESETIASLPGFGMASEGYVV